MMRLVTHNLQWKALSLAIAIVLWLIVVREPELVTSQAVPIFYKNLSKDMEIGTDAPDRVHVEIRGPAGKLSPASLADTAVLIDLSSVQTVGERTFSVSESGLNLPSGVAFLRAVPSELRLRFDHILSKDVPVQVRIGTPQPAGYRVVQQEARPNRLRITGPETRVRAIESAQTDPVDLSGVYSRAEFRVHAYVVDGQVRFEGPAMVTASISVQKNSTGK